MPADADSPSRFFFSSKARRASWSRSTGEEKEGSFAMLHVLFPMDRRASGEGEREEGERKERG